LGRFAGGLFTRRLDAIPYGLPTDQYRQFPLVPYQQVEYPGIRRFRRFEDEPEVERRGQVRLGPQVFIGHSQAGFAGFTQGFDVFEDKFWIPVARLVGGCIRLAVIHFPTGLLCQLHQTGHILRTHRLEEHLPGLIHEKQGGKGADWVLLPETEAISLLHIYFQIDEIVIEIFAYPGIPESGRRHPFAGTAPLGVRIHEYELTLLPGLPQAFLPGTFEELDSLSACKPRSQCCQDQGKNRNFFHRVLIEMRARRWIMHRNPAYSPWKCRTSSSGDRSTTSSSRLACLATSVSGYRAISSP
jgi:hypothetical protein